MYIPRAFHNALLLSTTTNTIQFLVLLLLAKHSHSLEKSLLLNMAVKVIIIIISDLHFPSVHSSLAFELVMPLLRRVFFFTQMPIPQFDPFSLQQRQTEPCKRCVTIMFAEINSTIQQGFFHYEFACLFAWKKSKRTLTDNFDTNFQKLKQSILKT